MGRAKAKKFALALVRAEQGPVVAEFRGQGLVEVPVVTPELDDVLGFRSWAAKEITAATEPEDQSSAVYKMIIRLVQAAVDAELSDTDALAIINATGGPVSEFTYELARRFGVSDIHKPAAEGADDGGTFQGELPT